MLRAAASAVTLTASSTPPTSSVIGQIARLVDRELHVLLDVLLEARQLDRDLVRAGEQVGGLEQPFAVGGRGCRFSVSTREFRSVRPPRGLSGGLPAQLRALRGHVVLGQHVGLLPGGQRLRVLEVAEEALGDLGEVRLVARADSGRGRRRGAPRPLWRPSSPGKRALQGRDLARRARPPPPGPPGPRGRRRARSSTSAPAPGGSRSASGGRARRRSACPPRRRAPRSSRGHVGAPGRRGARRTLRCWRRSRGDRPSPGRPASAREIPERR